MTLQSSGAISISQIKAELGSSSNSLRDLSAAAGKSTPDAMSEFYGYSAAPPPPPPVPTAYYGGSWYGATEASGTPNDAASYHSFGSFGANPSYYPYQDYFDYNLDSGDDTYGDRSSFPAQGSMDSYLVLWYPTGSMYNTAYACCAPNGYSYYNWTTAYYIGDASYYDFSIDGFNYYIVPDNIGSSIGTARAIGEYELI